MSWSPDMPYENLNQAALTFVDISGHESYASWLEQELSRVRVYLRTRYGRSNPQTPVEAEPDDAHDVIALEALSFYANQANYISRRGKPPKIEDDKGDLARKAIAEISGDAA